MPYRVTYETDTVIAKKGGVGDLGKREGFKWDVGKAGLGWSTSAVV